MPTCSICLETLDVCREVCVRTKCRHDYHGKCLSKWFIIRPDCPSCREGLSRTECKVVYLGENATETLKLNGIRFRLSEAHDVYVCLLFLFYLQHQIVLSVRSLASSMQQTLHNVAFEIATRLSTSARHVNIDEENSIYALDFPRFYGRKCLSIRLHDSSPCALHLAVDDIRPMFTGHREVMTLPSSSLHASYRKDGGNLH